MNVVQDEPFTKREIAQRQVFSPEAAKNRVEENGTADVQIRAPRIQPRHVETLLDVRFDESLPQSMYRLRADALVSDVLWRGAFLLRDRQRAETENRARGSDHAIEAGLRDLSEVRPHLFVEMFDEPTFVVRRERIGLYEPLRQPNDARLEALAERQVGRRPEGHFHASAANINDHGGAAADVYPVACRQMNEPGFFSSRDNADPDAGLSADLGNEVAAVFGFSSRTGRGSDNFVNLVRFGQALEFGQCLHGRGHCRSGQVPPVQPAGPEPDHILFPVNHFEGKIGADLDHDHVDRVGPDIDGRNAHAGVDSSAGPALACYTSDIYLRTRQQMKGSIGRHPTMNTRAPRVTTVLLQRLSRALKRHLPQAVAGDDLAVHQARVTSRRLREAVPVLATGLSGSKAGKARRKIRRLTRALGSVRELDVTVQLLDELARSPYVSRDAVEDVRARVMKERDAKRKTMIERLEDVNVEKLDRRLASVGSALNEATAEPWRKALAARLLRRSRRLTLAMSEAGQMYAPERLHAVRIAAKKLRYGLELAAGSGLKQAAPHVRTIKRAQELLGKLHDLQVLQNHVAAVQAEPRTGRIQSRAALENLGRQIEDQCRLLHGRYVASASALREASIAVRKVIVPQLANPPRRARSIKMTLSRPADARAIAGDR
jgi:CHAD domain-containing protein